MKTKSVTPSRSRKPDRAVQPALRTPDLWSRLAQEGSRLVSTPFQVLSSAPIHEALAELETLNGALRVPLRHWLSLKTQPVRSLLQWWRKQGRGVEVVSEFELQAAVREGFPPTSILVNGPAKHHWLPRHPLRGLWVNFDSEAEVQALLALAKSLNWGLGVRCHTREEFDPENPDYPTQVGLSRQEASQALRLLREADARLETVHFQLRSNVASPVAYERAIDEVAAICWAAGFSPKYLDCGGGLPPHNVSDREGKPVDAGFSLAELGQVYKRALIQFPDLLEVWMENGRFLTARSGALVVTVLDIKSRGGVRYLICDGGRTNHAMVSQWESHGLLVPPERIGEAVASVVCGPTCMAFDQLTRRSLPADIQSGDRLVWLDAGAYHIPWENRFSYGHSAVLWHDDEKLKVIRPHQPFDAWWGQWGP